MRHVAVLTGKRGGYGAMKPMLRAIESDAELHLSLIVTDQHLNAAFGSTVQEVQKDFDPAAAVDMEQVDGSPRARSAALGICLTRMTDVLADMKPDLLLLYGDRGEVLATAIAALHLRIPIGHIQGGDRSGNVDDLMRHAMTKLAQFHFPATKDSADRIITMGEHPGRVFVVGDNHLDTIVNGTFSSEKIVRSHFDLSSDQAPIIVLQHPETLRDRSHYEDMVGTLDAALSMNRRVICIYPCSDHGYQGIVDAIEERRGHEHLSIYKNIEAPDFWGLMNVAAALVGNSSAGLIETPSFGLPAINLGERQLGRSHSGNVIHSAFGKNNVACALDQALSDAFREQAKSCPQIFGDGTAGVQIAKIIKTVALDAAYQTE